MSNLKESMLEGKPFPKLHTKAAETKGLVQPIAAVLKHFREEAQRQDAADMDLMLQVLECSFRIDEVVSGMEDFKVTSSQGKQLEDLVMQLNAGTARLCQIFMARGLYLFNFVPKNHYLFHLAQLGRHMSPKLAWCYQGEDLMQKVKILAQGSFAGTPPRKLGNKILAKYSVGLACVLSSC